MDTQAAPLTLNDLEWQAVSLALKDATTCGCGDVAEPSAITKVFRTVFSVKPTLPLADPKLEAVRRFVCVAKRRGQADVPKTALSQHGYNARQIAALTLLSR